MSVITRFSRFGIFAKGKIQSDNGPIGATSHQETVPSDDKRLGTSQDQIQRITNESDTSLQNIVTVETTQPSYFGYLSGVVSSLWNPTQHKVEHGEHQVTSPPVKEKKTKIILKKVSRTEVVGMTQTMANQLLLSNTEEDRLKYTTEFIKHLIEFPASRLVAVQRFPELIAHLLKQEKSSSAECLKGNTRKCLALLGYVKPLKGSGIRILSIDGGGTRGMMGLEVLAELEKDLGSKICDHFDLICGVSTGAIISVLLGAKRMHVQSAKEIYKDISTQLFNQGKISGVSGLLMSHSYYNTKKWVEILQKTLGEDQVLDTAQYQDSVKIAVISCIVNAAQLQPFVFRNYEHPAGRDSHFRGATQHKLWQAIQASAAAPGYFEEVSLGTVLHQDGGVLANNPTAISLHEARLLWPTEPIQCVVSVGNGRTVTELELPSTIRNTGIQDKISKIVDSATDTELVHNSMSDLLPPHSYFRLNPYMSFPYTLDEIDPARLEQMVSDARSYVRRNRQKIFDAAFQLNRPPPLWKIAKRGIDHVKNVNGRYSPQ